jgi:beta-lactam-binding protein with PASTA domain
VSTILYGNFSLAIVDGRGTRIERAGRGPAAPDLLTPRHPEAPRAPLMRGRTRESADALSALNAGRPLEFHASCGYGKTTLLLRVAALAAGHGIAPHCLYLRMDSDRVEDLLHQLVARLFSSARPVKLTPDQCAQVLGAASAVVAIDDVSADPMQVGYLLDVLRGCRVLIGAARPVLDQRGTSQSLSGLPAEAALALLADELARPLGEGEQLAARRLVAAVDGQPLHLRQAAALVRDGGQTLPSLAQQAERDPGVLDRLSVGGLAEGGRRALMVLALVAGALITPNVAAIIGGIADVGESLDSLGRRGLAEQRDDRFGLPACKAAGYRELLLKDLSVAASAHALRDCMAVPSLSAIDSQSAADAALAVIELAAGRGDWETVAELARAADAALFVAGRWQAWHQVLERGLAAAKATGDSAADAYFSHQLGSLAACRDQLTDAVRLLQYALALREQLGDLDGADLTRNNLRMLEPPGPPRRPRPLRRVRARVRQVAGLAAAVGGLSLAAAGIALALTAGSGTVNVTRTATSTPVAVTSPATWATPTATSPSASGPTTTTTSPAVATPATSATTSARTSASATSSVSPSAKPVIVPSVVGMSQSAATTDLGNATLIVTVATTSACGTIQYGDVVTQDPPGGTSLSSGAAVSISVCTVVTVADVINETQSFATATLQNQGLNVTTGPVTDCGSVPYGSVVNQDPAAGTIVTSDATVVIGVCDALPDVVGMTQSAATSTLDDLGMTTTAETSSDCAQSDAGNVLDQDPAAGSAAPAGSAVTITVCGEKDPAIVEPALLRLTGSTN